LLNIKKWIKKLVLKKSQKDLSNYCKYFNIKSNYLVYTEKNKITVVKYQTIFCFFAANISITL
jgi:hypothetical protein